MRNRDFSKRKNIFCSFLLIKLFTVVIITVVRSGRYKRFRMCSGLEFYSKTKDSHRRLFAVATDESTFHLLLSLEQTQCFVLWSPDSRLQARFLLLLLLRQFPCVRCVLRLQVSQQTHPEPQTHTYSHTHYDPSHTPCLLTHRVAPSLTVLPYQHTLTHTHTLSLLSHNKSSVQILSPSL